MNDNPYRTAAEVEVPIDPIQAALHSYASTRLAGQLMSALFDVARYDLTLEGETTVPIDDLGRWRPYLEDHFSPEVADRIIAGEPMEKAP